MAVWAPRRALQVSLPATFVFDYPTVASMADYCARLGERDQPRTHHSARAVHVLPAVDVNSQAVLDLHGIVAKCSDQSVCGSQPQDSCWCAASLAAALPKRTVPAYHHACNSSLTE